MNETDKLFYYVRIKNLRIRENGTSQGGGFNSILAMLPALMQRQGVDPSLFALCNGKSNGNGWGDGLFAILLLFLLMGRGNFFGGNNGGCLMPNGQGGVMLNNDANTAVIMQAVQRNGYDVQSLATSRTCAWLIFTARLSRRRSSTLSLLHSRS